MAGVNARAIVALDVERAEQATALTARLGAACDFVKIGLELFTAEGPAIVRTMTAEKREVFLDLKLHDIPNTVRGAASRAAALGASLLTVHAGGGRAMIEAAVAGAGDRCDVFAVTVLTSLDASALSEAWGKQVNDVRDEVLRLAEVAHRAGARGVVCGGGEAAAVRDRFGGELATLVPGIRRAGASADDQARIATPKSAVTAGARYLVLGRAVTGAADPRAELAAILEEMRS